MRLDTAEVTGPMFDMTLLSCQFAGLRAVFPGARYIGPGEVFPRDQPQNAAVRPGVDGAKVIRRSALFCVSEIQRVILIVQVVINLSSEQGASKGVRNSGPVRERSDRPEQLACLEIEDKELEVLV